MGDSTVYGDFAKDRSGWFFGLTGPQLATVVLAGLPEVVALNSDRWLLVGAWLPVWALIVALVVVPVRGRPAARWLFDLILHAVGTVLGWTTWSAQPARDAGWDQAALPGVLAGIRIHDGPPHGPTMSRLAVVQDTAAQTWAV